MFRVCHEEFIGQKDNDDDGYLQTYYDAVWKFQLTGINSFIAKLCDSRITICIIPIIILYIISAHSFRQNYINLHFCNDEFHLLGIQSDQNFVLYVF